MPCCKQGVCGSILVINIGATQTEDTGFACICNISHEICTDLSLFFRGYASLALGSRKIASVPVK